MHEGTEHDEPSPFDDGIYANEDPQQLPDGSASRSQLSLSLPKTVRFCMLLSLLLEMSSVILSVPQTALFEAVVCRNTIAEKIHQQPAQLPTIQLQSPANLT